MDEHLQDDLKHLEADIAAESPSPFVAAEPPAPPAAPSADAPGTCAAADADGEPENRDAACVFCHAAIRVRCQSRPSWCAARCPHDDCHALLEAHV